MTGTGLNSNKFLGHQFLADFWYNFNEFAAFDPKLKMMDWRFSESFFDWSTVDFRLDFPSNSGWYFPDFHWNFYSNFSPFLFGISVDFLNRNLWSNLVDISSNLDASQVWFSSPSADISLNFRSKQKNWRHFV